MPNQTYMRKETAEIPQVLANFLRNSADSTASIADQLRQKKPTMIATIARGSSDHAASFLKYAFEITAGIPVASLAPSVASIYGAELTMAGAASFSISQSGESPDIIALTQTVKAGGALSIALTNKPGSKLAATVHDVLDIAAGPELSVAATKSFVASIFAGLAILAEWQNDDGLRAALAAFPDHAAQALTCDWQPLSPVLDQANSFYVVGRGPSMAIAHEVALKFKETCGMHAEAYSAAEVMHGPMALVKSDFPVVALVARDASEAASIVAIEKLSGDGAQVFATTDKSGKVAKLSFIETGHPLTDALCLIMPFYCFVEAYARHRGLDPDRPPLLKKVTQTR